MTLKPKPTEQPTVDKLREEIYKLLCKMTVPGEGSTMSASIYWEKERYRITDKILAKVQPLIEQARKEERGKILSKGYWRTDLQSKDDDGNPLPELLQVGNFDDGIPRVYEIILKPEELEALKGGA